MQVLDEVVARGASPEYIRVLSITVAPPALKQLSEKYPGAEKVGKHRGRPASQTCKADMQEFGPDEMTQRCLMSDGCIVSCRKYK